MAQSVERGGGSGERTEKTAARGTLQTENDVPKFDMESDNAGINITGTGLRVWVRSSQAEGTNDVGRRLSKNREERPANMDQEMVDTDQGMIEDSGNMEIEQENQNWDSGSSWCGRDRDQGPTTDDMKEPASVLGVKTGGSFFAMDEDVLQDDMELDALQIPEKEWERLEYDAVMSWQLRSATFIRNKDMEEGSQRGVILAPRRQHI